MTRPLVAAFARPVTIVKRVRRMTALIVCGVTTGVCAEIISSEAGRSASESWAWGGEAAFYGILVYAQLRELRTGATNGRAADFRHRLFSLRFLIGGTLGVLITIAGGPKAFIGVGLMALMAVSTFMTGWSTVHRPRKQIRLLRSRQSALVRTRPRRLVTALLLLPFSYFQESLIWLINRISPKR